MTEPIFTQTGRLPPGVERPGLGGSTQNATGTTNGTSEVTMVTAPEDTYITVFLVTVHNIDSGARNTSIYLRPRDVPTGIANYFRIANQNISAGANWSNQRQGNPGRWDHVALNPGDSLVIALAAPPAVAEPRWTVHWAQPV